MTPHRFCLLAFFLLLVLQASAQRDMIDEQRYISALAAIDSTVVPEFIAGTASMDSGSYINACNHFAVVMEKAPGFAPVLRRYGWCEGKLGNLDSAVSVGRRAYGIDTSWESAIMLASVLLMTPPESNAAPMWYYEAQTILDDWTGKPGINEYEHLMLSLESAFASQDAKRADRMVRKGLELYPDSMASHFYAANLFIYYQDWAAAEEELRKAKELGLAPEIVQEMMASGVESEMNFARWKRRVMWTFLAWVSGLALLFLSGIILSFITLRKVEKQIAGGGPLETNGIRKVYRRVVNIAGVYYYLSLPFVLLLLLIVLGGTIFLFGRIPIYFFFLLLASGGTTIFFMIKTLVVKPQVEEQGRVLNETEAPALFALLREVATDMKTRPVEEVRLSPHVDMAVYERGTWREKMQDRATRVLVMGAGILNDFKVDEFRAVLAHEYGHFSNRDTAGGSVAFRVRTDIHRYAWSLALNGQARWWNLAYQFLRLYDFLFRRISHGATRLQEILADRAAAEMYGARSFENGLTHVIVKTIHFNLIAGNEIIDAKNEKRGFSNLYELPLRFQDKIEEEIKESMSRTTTNDDTHPCPNDRFRYISGIKGLKLRQSTQTVTELFRDWNAITHEQTQAVELEWKDHPAPGV
jgi:Zn-dependent protease with chaperone function